MVNCAGSAVEINTNNCQHGISKAQVCQAKQGTSGGSRPCCSGGFGERKRRCCTIRACNCPLSSVLPDTPSVLRSFHLTSQQSAPSSFSGSQPCSLCRQQTASTSARSRTHSSSCMCCHKSHCLTWLHAWTQLMRCVLRLQVLLLQQTGSSSLQMEPGENSMTSCLTS